MVLSEYFYYDETSPSCLRWKISRYQFEPYFKVLCVAGDVAGKLDKKGYWIINTRGLIGEGVRISWGVHRVVFELFNNRAVQDGLVIDHIDRNPSNNKISNLREVEWKYNARNRGKIRGKIGDGISLCRKKWPKPNQHRTSEYLLARITDDFGKRVQKHFSTEKLGYDMALELAKEWRAKMIQELNDQGAGYSPSHGK